MATKAKARPAPKAAPKVAVKPVAAPAKLAVKPVASAAKLAVKPTANLIPMNDPWLTPPATMEERLSRIEILGERIEEYIKFMGGVGKLNGTSAELKHRAVAMFYERLFLLEQELCKIQENLQLG